MWGKRGGMEGGGGGGGEEKERRRRGGELEKGKGRMEERGDRGKEK